jgi:hypothetical protein|tara:strand:+ start:45 stop:239 length:195 start_codon:yes stop_codon:yes gene_type:complete
MNLDINTFLIAITWLYLGWFVIDQGKLTNHLMDVNDKIFAHLGLSKATDPVEGQTSLHDFTEEE